MKIFIGWAGERSRAAAESFRNWLPQVVQSFKPWMSETDIQKGAQWNTDLTGSLKETNVGLFCLTADNLTAAWLLFEAGAISKRADSSRVWTFLLDLSNTDVPWPLAQFQHTQNSREDIRKLIGQINSLQEQKLDEGRLQASFDLWWPDLETKLKEALTLPPEATKPKRDIQEMMEEALGLLREIASREVARRSPMPEMPAGLRELLASTRRRRREIDFPAYAGLSERLRCRCDDETHGHLGGRCQNLITELDGYCNDCRLRLAEAPIPPRLAT